MIYDTESLPVASCAILLEGPETLEAASDINGRFLFDFLPYGRHELVFRKEGYEEYRTDFDFVAKSQVFYGRLVSRESLLKAAEKAIDAMDWKGAADYLSRADQIGIANPLSGYLHAVIAYRLKDYVEAAKLLEELLRNDFKEAHIYLFLADLYEGPLKEAEKAMKNLRSYLALREDAEVRKRLETLERSAAEQEKPNTSLE